MYRKYRYSYEEQHELHGPVETDQNSKVFLGAKKLTNHTAELSGMCMALLYLLTVSNSVSEVILMYDAETELTRPYEAWSSEYKPRSLAQRPTQESYRSARCSHVACVGVVRSEVFDETSDSLVKYRLILPYEGRSRARRS